MRDADSAAFDPIKRSPAASGQSIEWKGKVQGRQMEVGLIFKIAAVGILVTILSQVLKHSGREEHAFLLSLAKACFFAFAGGFAFSAWLDSSIHI